MSISLKLRWLIEAVAITLTPLALARARVSSGAAALIWSTSRRAPVSSASAMSRSSMMVSAATGLAGRPMRPANSPSVAAAPSVSQGSAGRWATSTPSALA